MPGRIFLITLILLFSSTQFYCQTVVLHPAYRSIGVEVDLPDGFDDDNSSYCKIKYKSSNTENWKEAFTPDRIVYSGQSQFRGSLFFLESGSSYDIMVSIRDSIPEDKIIFESTTTASTLENPEISTGQNIKWVSPDGSGNIYSKEKPGRFKELMESGTVHCGTTVYLMDGVYTDLPISFHFYNSCTEETPINIMAAPGAHPVIDGAYQGKLTWTQSATDSLLYQASLPAGTGYTNICIINGNNLYPYPTLNAFWYFHNNNLRDLSFHADGFLRDNNNIWIKTKAGTDPNNSEVTISKAFRFITVYGNNHDGYLHFKGLIIKNVAKNNVSNSNISASIAFDLRSINHIWFDSCVFEYNNYDIIFYNECKNILIENCTFKNDNGLYSHVMIKRSPLYFLTESTSYARNRETVAITFNNNKNVTLRNSKFVGTNSGIYLNNNDGVAEMDVYNNEFIDNFDAVECDGNWVNLRVWNNRFEHPMSGISAAPPNIGPRYFYRNVFFGMRGRENAEDDPYFIGCNPPSAYFSPATGIKTNSSGISSTRGNLYFFNNTFYSDDTLGFTMEPWLGEWKNIYFVNNIFADNIKHPFYFHGLKDKTDFQFSSNHDSYFSYDETMPLLLAKEIHGQYNCQSWYEVDSFQSKMSTLTGSNKINFNQPFHQNPGFKNIGTGDFSLVSSSPLIDKGVIIPGFDDYQGLAPDIGAFESNITSYVKGNQSNQDVFIVYPNPSSGTVFIRGRNNEIPSFVHLLNMQGTDMGISLNPISNTISLRHLPSGMYMLAIGQQSGKTSYYKLLKI